MAMMLCESLADSGLGAGQPFPKCPDVVGSRAAAPANYPRPLLTPHLGVFQVLLWVHGICLEGWADVAGEMGVGAEGSRPILLDYFHPGPVSSTGVCIMNTDAMSLSLMASMASLRVSLPCLSWVPR